jgi:hypothetical protein
MRRLSSKGRITGRQAEEHTELADETESLKLMLIVIWLASRIE